MKCNSENVRFHLEQSTTTTVAIMARGGGRRWPEEHPRRPTTSRPSNDNHQLVDGSTARTTYMADTVYFQA